MFSKKFISTLALAALVVIVTGCDSTPQTTDEDIQQVNYKQLVELIERPGNRNNNVFKILSKEASQGKTMLVDVRSPAKFEQEHLPGAINITLPQIVENDPKLAEASNIVVYGSGWLDDLPPAAAKRLMSLKYKNVYAFRGGIELWKAEGGKTVTATNE